MPRLARLDAPGVLHHVMIRGIEGQKIFLRSRDYEDFLERLAVLLLGNVGAVRILGFRSGNEAISEALK